MKKSFNISSPQNGATCSLCQDTLLRHINQSGMFWYCPSCRQEMVCEEKSPQPQPAIATRIDSTASQRKLANVADLSRRISLSAS